MKEVSLNDTNLSVGRRRQGYDFSVCSVAKTSNFPYYWFFHAWRSFYSMGTDDTKTYEIFFALDMISKSFFEWAASHILVLPCSVEVNLPLRLEDDWQQIIQLNGSRLFIIKDKLHYFVSFSAQIKNQFTSDVAVVYAFLLSIQSFVTSIKFIIHVGCRRVFLNGSEKNIEVKLKRYS